MGADIHISVERRDGLGAWSVLDPTLFGRPYRNYHVFNRLAGVRQETVRERGDTSEPVSAPRGLPGDSPSFHDLTEEDFDDYSHSWLLVSELVDVPGRDELQGLLRTLDPLGLLEPSDRLVFWFD